MSEPASRSSGSGHRRSRWGAAKRLALLVLVMASIGALCGAGISSLRRGEFSSTATVSDSPASGDLSAAAQTARTIAPGVVPASSTISITTDDLEGLLIITATDDTADVAQRSATTVAELYVAQAPDATARIASEASRPATPAANRARNILIGLGIGTLSGVVFAVRLRPKPVSGPAPTIAYSPLAAGPPPNTHDPHRGQSGELPPVDPLRDLQPLDDEQPGPDEASETDFEITAQTSPVSNETTPARRRADPVRGEAPERLNGHTPVIIGPSEGPGGATAEVGRVPAPEGVFAAASSRTIDAAGPERSGPPEDAPGGADTQTPPPLSTAGNGDPVTPPTPSDGSIETSAATATTSAATASQARLDDLVAQISFLDSEVARYRDTLETERIRHARVMAEKSMAADAALDQARRREQGEIERLHRSYRELLADRQIEFERALSTALAEHEQRLEAEHQRHAADLERERTRRDVEIEAARRRVIDETADAMRTAVRSSRGDHEETDGQQLADLRNEVAELTDRCAELERTETRQAQEVQMLRRRLLVNEGQGDYRVAHLEEQVAIAEQRLEAERARSAATLAELLAQSAAIAAEVDAAREENKSIRAAADEAIASYRQRSRAEYEALVEAADEQKRIALAREAELEARIADLRSR